MKDRPECGLQGDQAQADGHLGQLVDGAGAQLGQHAVLVGLHGLGADVEGVPYLADAVAVGQQAEDLLLARREHADVRPALGGAETLAVLAGDALQPEAFRLILEAPMLPADTKLEALRVLVKACGADGMVGGQVLDTVYNVDTAEGLTQLNRLKTGVMISGAAELGCVAAKMNLGMRSQALKYADGIGRAFQIRDDMLDVVGDAAVFGKTIGSDKEKGKVTFVDVLGLDGCAREVERCTESAKAAVANWSDHMFLWELADRMVGRNK